MGRFPTVVGFEMTAALDVGKILVVAAQAERRGAGSALEADV
jgi:hypothetical protein